MTPTLYTVDEVADILRLSAETVRDYIHDGHIRGMKVGNRWRVSEEALTAFIKARYER